MAFIKIDKEILNSYCFSNPNHLKIWIWMLVKANYKKCFVPINSGRGISTIEVDRGQFIFGRFKAEEELNLNGSLIYRTLQKFEELGQINLQSNNQYTIITICKYDDYQNKNDKNEQQINNERTTNEQSLNNERTIIEQSLNTSKEVLEDKEYKEDIRNKGENLISNGTWEDEKKYFMIDEQYQIGICSRHKLKKEEVENYIKEFLSTIELNQDFKSNKELKRHFTNWINKKILSLTPKQYNPTFDPTKVKIVLK